MTSITFEGQPSGDHVSFCWNVTAEEYERVTGRKPDKWAAAAFAGTGYYRLYPDDILHHMPDGKVCRITISVEEAVPVEKAV